MKYVRLFFGLIGVVWLIGIMAFGAGTSWLMHDPDAAAGVALGAIAVDADAGVMDNARGFAGGFSAGRDLSKTIRDVETKNKLRSQCKESEDSDWGSPEYCDDIEQSDRETYERISNEW
jgi:hypothetical protein